MEWWSVKKHRDNFTFLPFTQCTWTLFKKPEKRVSGSGKLANAGKAGGGALRMTTKDHKYFVRDERRCHVDWPARHKCLRSCRMDTAMRSCFRFSAGSYGVSSRTCSVI